jgi:hypothetical protein
MDLLNSVKKHEVTYLFRKLSLKNCYFPVNYFIGLLPTKYLFIVMQISEYAITNEIGEHSYTFIYIYFLFIYFFFNKFHLK